MATALAPRFRFRSRSGVPVAPGAPPAPARWRRLALAGAAGPPLFLLVATVAGLLTPGYDAVTQPVSLLALGPLGWIQTLNFYAFGATVVAAGWALYAGAPEPAPAARRGARLAGATAAILLTCSGLSLVAAGVLPADAPGAPPTPTGLLHGLTFFGTVVPLPGAYAFLALRLLEVPRWRRHALLTATLPSAVFFLVFLYGVLGSEPDDPLAAVSGVLQRVLLLVAFGWLTPTLWRLRSRPEGEPGPGGGGIKPAGR